MKKVDELLIYAVMLDSLTAVYIQFMIMLIELQKVLSQELKCLCSNTTTVLSEWTIPKLWMWASYIFITFEINKYIVCVCRLYRYLYIMYMEYIYTLQVCMSISSIVIHYIEWCCQSSNPPEINCFQWEFSVWFVWCFPGLEPWCKMRPACYYFWEYLIIFTQM